MNGAYHILLAGFTGHLLAGAAGGSGGDDPSHRMLQRSVHEADFTPTRRKKPRTPEGPVQCPVCSRSFSSDKAVHGHMRCHPERTWRGMDAPIPGAARAAPAAEKAYRYMCSRCKAQFATRQALGGHRASHNGKKGCYWQAREEDERAAAGAAGPSNKEEKQPKFDFDLNAPPPEEY